MPSFTVVQMVWIVAVYVASSILGGVLLGFIRLWRGPSNRDLSRAVLTVTRWIGKTNSEPNVTHKVRSITIWESGQVDSQVNKNPSYRKL